MFKNNCTNRQGTIYVAVMGVTLIVAIMASVGMVVVRLESRIVQANAQQQQARLLAQSAVEFAVNWIQRESNWRNILVNGYEGPATNYGQGSIAWKAVDADGDFTNDLQDPVEIQGIGRVGEAVVVESVTLEPGGPGLSCLNAAMHSNGQILLQGGALLGAHRIDSDQSISANGQIDASASYANINANAWSTTAITGSVSGSQSANQNPAREMPGPQVFDYYKSNGTWIDITSLPDVGGKRTIDKRLISPAANPFGATNAEGIYVIDCGGAVIEIANSRIVGTLVLLNPGAGSRTNVTVYMQAAVGNYPALLVEGDFRLGHWDLWVGEPALGVNFNPPGTPYLGEEDSVADDQYPSSIDGLVYISGQMTFTSSDSPVVNGCLVCGTVVADGILTANYSDVYLNYPPPGFATGDPMRIQRGSWKRTSYTY